MNNKLTPPHCDERLIHHKSLNCKYCNELPLWQNLRELWGINCSGENDPNKITCPAEQRRSKESLNAWHGNIPMTPEREEALNKAWDEIRDTVTEMMKERNELLPCPFCGGEGKVIKQTWLKSDYYGVVCEGECSTFFDCRAKSHEQAVTEWNKRYNS